MTPEERSRARHPAGHRRPSPALRAVHSDPHSWGQQSSRATENAGRPSPIAVAAVVQLALGVIVATWAGDWRVLVTAAAVFLVLAVVGARLDRRPR